MPDTPLLSKFALDGTVDTATSLPVGVGSVETILAEDLSDIEDEVMIVIDATGAAFQGFAVIEDEFIEYSARFSNDRILDLARSRSGTTAAEHLTGATVILYPRYSIPQAVMDAIIALQEKVNDLQAQIDGLG